jgi:hypothetical protein
VSIWLALNLKSSNVHRNPAALGSGATGAPTPASAGEQATPIRGLGGVEIGARVENDLRLSAPGDLTAEYRASA